MPVAGWDGALEEQRGTAEGWMSVDTYWMGVGNCASG